MILIVIDSSTSSNVITINGDHPSKLDDHDLIVSINNNNNGYYYDNEYNLINYNHHRNGDNNQNNYISSLSQLPSSSNRQNVIFIDNNESLSNNNNDFIMNLDQQQNESAIKNNDNDSDLWSLPQYEIIIRLFGAIICIALIISTIIGNVLVIIVVARFNRMRTVTNILLASFVMLDYQFKNIK